mgnify:CR=1 FL=1
MHSEPLSFVALLALAMATGIVMRRLALPYTVGLVLVGAALAIAHVPVGAPLTRDFIFNFILPPLLFEAALNLRWRDLRADMGVLLALSTLGTVISAVVIAFAMSALAHWPFPLALVFGALIAATDPVAVIAMFKDNKMHGRVRTLVEGESLFNDAAAAILFALVLPFAATGAAPTLIGASGQLLYAIGIGATVGALVSGAALFVAGRASDHLTETALTVLAAFASFFIAEALHASGILATVIAGLVMGNFGVLREGEGQISNEGRGFALAFWDFAAFLANSAVFPLIGLAIGMTAFTAAALPTIAIAILAVLIARAAAVYPLSLLFARSRQAVPPAEQHVLWWGGLRGALGLALALSLPENLPYRAEIVTTTFAVVAFSIVVQGLTMPLLLRRLGFVGKTH